ncbi:protein FAM3C-like isoform X2 [Cololabis saira]|uniref:protein FAM3C-like isoform X2 n=1 Tax=Cololabis saira TaxID=129043 RepID=UPI002AD4CA77|nr:protein FAM3C-like isoform X2 [Cololabis saira]
MLTIKVGLLKAAMLLVPALVVVVVVLQLYSNPLKVTGQSVVVRENSKPAPEKKPAGTCYQKTECPDDQISFYIQTGAANVVGPLICIHNNLIVGTILNNAGPGINIVTLNGRTGEVLKIGNFNMYGGEVGPLIEFLKNIEEGSIVLFASFDEPATKLNEEARKLIAELGSSMVQTLGFRDSWAFVGGKGTTGKSTLEKYLKNEKATNKYDSWPELVHLEGCLPRFLA